MAVKLVPTVSVVVVRDGKRVKPEIGKSFDFTADERDSILATMPTALRKPVNEDTAADDDSTGSAAEASQTKAKGGKKAATADKSDKEAAGKTDPDEDL